MAIGQYRFLAKEVGKNPELVDFSDNLYTVEEIHSLLDPVSVYTVEETVSLSDAKNLQNQAKQSFIQATED